MMAYRAAVHETTKVSPHEMMFGRTINLPIDLVIGHPDSNYIVPEYRCKPKSLHISLKTCDSKLEPWSE
jgi:hypothetical protein